MNANRFRRPFIGLGNPGREYEKTRHNLGYMVVTRLAAEYQASLKKYRHAAALAVEISSGEATVLLAEPLTYMNNSGVAVRDIVHFEKLERVAGNGLCSLEQRR